MAEDIATGYLLSKGELKSLDKRIKQFHALDELPEAGPDFVIFDFDDDFPAYEALISLRRQETYRYCPFYSWDNMPSDKRALLLDGHFDETAYPKIEAMRERLVSCTKNDDEATRHTTDVHLILARYLFMRSHKKIEPHIEWTNPYGFSYPLLEALSAEGNANDHWYVLNSLVKREYLQIEDTVSELQTCTECNGGLLNFKNCCPNCESVDLHIEPFVHCFSCGNIGPVKEFMQHQELVCSRCQAKLKHIGIDYDKPLEDKICERCQHRFFEPSTLSVCLVCERVSTPESLKTRKLNSFSLTRKGGEFAKNRLKKIAIDIGNFLELITFNLLELIIQWQAQLAKRHGEVQFVVGVVYVDNIAQLIKDVGFLNTEQQLVLFYESVRKLFRKTDLLSVDDEKLFCFLSMTNLEHINVIQQRIYDFEKNAPDDAPKLVIKSGFLSSSEIVETDMDKSLLVNELLNRVSA